MELENAIVIPQKITYEIQGKKFVYVLNPDNTVTSQVIEVMDSHDGLFYVVSSGLKEGDVVVLEGLGTLRDGMTIQPVPVTNTDSLYQDLHSNK